MELPPVHMWSAGFEKRMSIMKYIFVVFMLNAPLVS